MCARGQLLQKQFTHFLLSVLKWNCIYSINQGSLQMEQEELLGLQIMGLLMPVFLSRLSPVIIETLSIPLPQGHIQHPFLFFHCEGCCKISQLEEEDTSRCGEVEFCLGEGQKNAKNKLGSQQHPCLGLMALTPRDTTVFTPSEAPAWDL